MTVVADDDMMCVCMCVCWFAGSDNEFFLFRYAKENCICMFAIYSVMFVCIRLPNSTASLSLSIELHSLVQMDEFFLFFC
jgi:hypothetical protein